MEKREMEKARKNISIKRKKKGFNWKLLIIVVLLATLIIIPIGIYAFKYTSSSYSGRIKLDTGMASETTSSSYNGRIITGNQPVGRVTTDSYSGRLGILDDGEVLPDTTPPAINFTYPTPQNATIQTFNSVYVNVSSSDDRGEHSTFVDWNRSLVAWWRMDENISTKLVDYTGIFNGTITNAKQNSSGIRGKSFTFGGGRDNIVMGNLGIKNQFTASVWIKPSSLVGSGDLSTYGYTVLASAASGQGYPFWLTVAGTEARVWAYESGATSYTQTSGAGLTLNNWYHLAVTAINGSTTKVYVNGVERLSYTNGNEVPWSTQFTIGDLRPARNIDFEGSIDDVIMFNRALSSQEIKALYNATANQYYNNFTNLPNGDYTYKAYAQDLAGNVNSTEQRIITINANTAPQIIKLFNNSISNGITLIDGPSNTNISLNFSVYDAEGASDLIDSSAALNISKAGEETRYNYSCSKTQSDGNYANYSCNVMLWWFDGDGAWSIGANITDTAGLAAINSSTTIVVNPLTGFSTGPSVLSWNTIAPASKNQTPTTFLMLNNTGNQDIATGNIDINATHLYGEIDNTRALYSGNFSVSNTTSVGKAECDISGKTSSVMNSTSGLFAIVAGANLSRGNYTGNNGLAQERLYFCLNYAGPELTSQPYSTSQAGAWTIRILVVLFTLSRKKRKEKSKFRLERISLLISEEIKDNYSKDKEKIAKLIIKEIKHTEREKSNEILQKAKPEIPVSAFINNLSALETIVKYSKENLNMNYHKIGIMIGRNERTIWTIYKRASKKMKKPLIIKKDKNNIPLEIFRDRKESIRKKIEDYLKKRSQKIPR